MFLSLTPIASKMETMTLTGNNAQGIDVTIKPTFQSKIPEVVVAPVSPFLSIAADHTKPTLKGDVRENDASLPDQDLQRDLNQVTDILKHQVNDNSIASSTNGYQDKPAPEPFANGKSGEILPPASRLKRRLEETKDLIVCPGVYDGFSARIALAVGFDTLYMVRSQTLASTLTRLSCSCKHNFRLVQGLPLRSLAWQI